MVLLIYPYGHPRIEVLGHELHRTKTLWNLYPVSDRTASVKAVLATGIKVVIPDSYAQDPVFNDVLLALNACQHPVQRASEYLTEINKPASAHAVPTTQHAAGVGSNTQAVA